MNKPCAKCPFRWDIPAYIKKERGEEIRDSLEAGTMFPCHETVEYGDGDEGRTTSKSKFCAGALILMEHEGGAHMNQMARISERLKLLDFDALEMDSPVHESWDDWIDNLE